MELFRQELPAGEGQLIVVYANEDDASQIQVVHMVNEVALDAARLSQEGWRLMSLASVPMRQMGTLGNVMLQSGGQYVTQVALVAAYSSLP